MSRLLNDMTKPAVTATATATATATRQQQRRTSGVAVLIATELTAVERSKIPDAEAKAVPVVRPESFGGEKTFQKKDLKHSKLFVNY